MPAHDISPTDDCSMAQDVSDDDFHDEDAESDYQSCRSSISDEEEERPEEYVEGELEILQWNYADDRFESMQASDVQDLVGVSTTSSEWISGIELQQQFHALMEVGERSLDAVAVLAETVGGPARWWHQLVSHGKEHGSRINFVFDLQALLIIIMSSKGAATNFYWWEPLQFHIPSQAMYQFSFTSSSFEGRILFDWSLDRPSRDLAEVMRIALPHFREMNARIDALSKLRNVDYSSGSSDSASIFGPTNMANLITCLDIAESVAKLVPVFGDVLEGACGILRKTISAAEVARAARDECKALAEHTACIALAIINEIGSTSRQPVIPTANIFDLCATIGEVERRITRLSTLGRVKYFTARGKINAEVKDLRVRVDNARIAFKIRSDISTTGLLYDLRMMQTRLASRVEDIYMGQQMTHHMLHTLLVEVRGHRTEDAHVEEAD
ncbi:hypothetical protein BDZ89DRAFT_1076625 [Hymenopellis radicata]|nr:hypothetical protein BDZ89DRAFT_1076625 [Hymenopellis radicata]